MAQPPFDLDYWVPDPRLEGLVSGYHFYSVAPAPGERHQDVFFPAWTNLRFHIAGDGWRVRLGETVYDIPRAALFGPTSLAGYSDAEQGAVAGAGLTPLGWYRLTRRPARDFADKVSPLDRLLDPAHVDGLFDALASADRRQIPGIFDNFFLHALSEPRPDEARVAAVHHYLMEPVHGGVAQMADRLGLSHRTLNRLGLAAFGFGPKLLVRRARFLRSLMALRDAEAETWSARIESSYYDHSHFIRDAREFLGMTPGEFLRLPKPMNDASARLRARILGAPAQALLQPRLTATR